MRAGPLTKRVTLTRLAGTKDTLGNIDPAQYTELATCWARIEPLTGRESMAALQAQSDISHRVTVRWQSALADLGPRDRIAYSSRVFDIRSVINVRERNVELQIMCTEHHQES